MKKIILSFMIVFASLPVFAFKEGDVLLYPSIALGYSILTNVESSRDDSVAVGYDANIAINGEFFILDELSISAGFGTEIKHSYTSIDADYETDWDTFDVIIKEKFLIIPVIARYHVLLSDDATLFFGAGMQYNKCISSEYEASSYALTEDISGKFKKTDEKMGIFEVGLYAETDDVFFGGGLRTFYGAKNKELSGPLTIEIGKNFFGQTINGYIGIKF